MNSEGELCGGFEPEVTPVPQKKADAPGLPDS
jgi:hypothetical protein